MQSVVRMLTDIELLKLENYEDSLEKAIALFIMNTGLKNGELLGLKIADVQDGKGNISTKITVSRKVKYRNNEIKNFDRVIHLNDSALKQIKYFLTYTKKKLGGEFSLDSFLLTTNKKRVMSSSYLFVLLNKLSSRLNISDFSAGLLRHHFALSLKKKGINFKLIQTLLGIIASKQLWSFTVLFLMMNLKMLFNLWFNSSFYFKSFIHNQ